MQQRPPRSLLLRHVPKILTEREKGLRSAQKRVGGRCGDVGRSTYRDWRFLGHDGNFRGMDSLKRLADPDFEPTDEDLIGLSQRAFAHVPEEHAESLRKIREAIAVARKTALERLRALSPDLKAAG